MKFDSLKSPLGLLLLTVIYFIAGKLSLNLAFFHPSASPIWPPTGIALAVFLLYGLRIWPAIFVGAFLVNITTAGNWMTSLAIASGNTLEGIVSALLVMRFANGCRAFETPKAMIKFVIFGGMTGPLVSATLGVTSLMLGGFVPWDQYSPVWLTWWLGDLSGALVVTPLLILWVRSPRTKWNARDFFSGLCAFTVLAVISTIVFQGNGYPEAKHYSFSFVVIPALIWIAFRFGLREAVSANFLLSAIAIWGTLRGSGPFILPSPNASLQLLQVFVAIISLIILTLGGAVAGMRQAETELRRSQERIRLVLESALDAIITINENGCVTDWNAQAETTFGWQRSEAMGLRLRDLIIPEKYREQHDRGFKKFLATGVGPILNKRIEISALRKNGEEFQVELAIVPLATARGFEFSAFLRDITDRKRAETMIQEKNRELETLLYVASHDLSEPLRGIENFSALVLERYAKNLDEKGQDFLHRIERASGRMRQLLTDLLMLSRVRTMEQDFELISGSTIVQEALGLLEATIRRTQAQIQIAPDLPALYVNRFWAIHAVSNLLSNAMKFTLEGKIPQIEVSGFIVSGRPQGETGLRIQDRGMGVAPEYRERIFKLFQRAVSRDIEGTGAGLAIVHEVAVRHGGRVWVESREGGGATFTITFANQKVS